MNFNNFLKKYCTEPAPFTCTSPLSTVHSYSAHDIPCSPSTPPTFTWHSRAFRSSNRQTTTGLKTASLHIRGVQHHTNVWCGSCDMMTKSLKMKKDYPNQIWFAFARMKYCLYRQRGGSSITRSPPAHSKVCDVAVEFWYYHGAWRKIFVYPMNANFSNAKNSFVLKAEKSHSSRWEWLNYQWLICKICSVNAFFLQRHFFEG